MRKSFTRFLSLLFVFCLVCTFTIVNAQNPAQETVKLYAGNTTACFNQSNVYSVNVSVKDFNKLSHFEIALSYPEAVLGYLNYQTLTGWTGGGITVSAPANGTVSITWTGSETTIGMSSVTDIIRLDFSLDGMAPASVQSLTWTKADFQYTLSSTGYAFTGSATPGSFAISQSYPDANILTTITSETCSGGQAKVKVTSPTGVYYSFNGLAYTSSNEFNATPGSNVTVKVKSTNGSADGCVSYAKTVAVPVAVNPVTFTPSSTNPTCPGGPGSVLISALGGSGAYTYYVNSSATTVGAMSSTNFQFNVPTNGTTTVTYQVAVQDANGCVDLTNSANWKPVQVVDNNPSVTFNAGSKTDVLCNGSNTGAISVSLTPAVKYFVSLNGGTWTATDTFGAKTFANLVAGTYTVTAKTVSDCTISGNAVYKVTDENPALQITGLTVTDTSCGGATTDGAIGVTIIGGSGTYTITIQEGSNVTTHASVSSFPNVFSGLKPVYYSLVATDANGCLVRYVNPNNTQNVIAVQSPADIKFTVSKTAILCNGQTSTLTVTNVTGGTGSYTYSVYDGAVTTTKSTPVFGALVAGTYTVTVANTSGGGCPISQVVTISQPLAPLSATAVVNFVPTCADGSDGDIMVTVTGGTPGFRYALNNGPLSAPSNSSVIHVAATVGNHTVRIVDYNGCEYIIPGTVTVTQNSNVITAVSNGVINCYGKIEGKIVVGVTSWAGGTATRVQEYKYSTVQADVFTTGSVLIPTTGTGTVTTLGAGTYYVGAIDQYGCKSNVKTVVITQNPMLEIVSVTPTGASCYNTFDGTITIVAKGGTASNTTGNPLQFAYVNNVLNPDVNSIEEARWQNMTYSSTTTFKTTFAVGKGDYYVFVRDVACAKLMWSQKITITGYDQLKIDETKIVVGQPTCYESANFTGSINVPVVSGGNGTYMYTLYKSGVAVTGHIQQASGLFTGLASGTYTVKAEDSTGCPSYTTSNTYTINEISKVVITSITKTNISCYGANDGLITINVDGGTYSSSVTTAQYSYAVNNQNLWVPFVGKSKTYLATQPGTFTIWVKDINGCTSSPATTVTILEPATISATVTVTKNKDCISGGAIAVTAAGGWTGGTATSTFEYKLDAAGTYTDTNVFTGLAAGTHSVTVHSKLAGAVVGYVDNATCIKVLNFTITQPDAITYSVSLSNVKCYNSATGSLSVTVLGGGTASSTGGYKVKLTGPSYDSGFVWTGSSKVKTFENLATGIYTVYVQDNAGCELSASVGDTEAPYATVESWNIQQPATALDVAATRISNAKCALSADGVFAITATGGVAPYSFFTAKSELPDHIVLPGATNSSTWTAVEGSTYTKTTATAGTWIVWAKDANGCIVGGEDVAGVPVNRWRVQILAPDPIIVVVGATTSATCNGKADGSIAITSIVGGTATYTVNVSGLSTGNVQINKSVTTTSSSVTVTGLPASLSFYTITISDVNGCLAATATKTVNEPTPITVTLTAAEGSFTCPGAIEGWLDAVGHGGAGSYEYKLYQDGVQLVNWTVQTTYFVQIGHTYKVEVKNVGVGAGTCTATAEVTINKPLAVEAMISETTCYMDPLTTAAADFKASAVVKATGEAGRTFSVRYRLNTASYPATYTAMPNGQLAIDGLLFSNVNVGQNFYFFEIIDNKGCKFEIVNKSFVPTQHPLQVSLVTQLDLSATIAITGGISPYSYKVGTSTSTVTLPTSGDTFQVVNLPAGQNTITVMDAHGCSVPQVVSVAPVSVVAVPASGANQMNTFDVALTFNRDVTGVASSTTVTGGTGTPTVTGSGKVYTVSVAGADMATVTLALGSGIKDAAGNTLSATTFTYTIGDHVSPTVTITDPAAPVAKVFTVGLTFSEAVSGVAVGTGVTVAGGTASLTGSGSTYSLTVTAAEQTEVTIVLTDLIKDLSANANKLVAKTVKYTTGDFTAPTATFSPNGTTTPTTNNYPALVMTFNENIAVGTAGSVKIVKKSDGVTTVTVPVSGVTVSGKTATITYAGGLDKNTEYYVLVDGTAVKDLAGNAFAGVTATTTWTFKTGPVFVTDAIVINSLEFKVYPNPFVDYVTVTNASELSKVVVSNIAGQVVKEVVNPSNTIQLDQLVSGVYFISLYEGNTVIKTVKIVKR